MPDVAEADEMTHSSMTPLLGPEFDDFVFATIAEDDKGSVLSVLSALARQGLDPWKETRALAKLPNDVATRRLASLIEMQSVSSLVTPDPFAAAARLISLLPTGYSKSSTPIATQPVAQKQKIDSKLVILLCLAIICGVLGSRFLSSKDDYAQGDAPKVMTPASHYGG